MKLTKKIGHSFNKVVESVVNHTRRHRWHIVMPKSDEGPNNYYVCKKTGDRKAEQNRLREDPKAADLEWLQAGSGRYYIDGQEFGEPTNAADAIADTRKMIAHEKAERRANQYLLFHTAENVRRNLRP